MKRAGFTMIELIFVIVILGILAAVAIPKLAATRDDAKISKMTTNISTLDSDAGTYYTSQGQTNWKAAATTVNKITNVELFTDTKGATSATSSQWAPGTGGTFYMVADPGSATASDCIKITTTVDGNVTAAKGGDTTSTVCKQVQVQAASMLKTYQYGGVGVVR
jgi:prepilin-type N-terminal cleavage/methylation domain-containing protein